MRYRYAIFDAQNGFKTGITGINRLSRMRESSCSPNLTYLEGWLLGTAASHTPTTLLKSENPTKSNEPPHLNNGMRACAISTK